jgi:hypothetical protein
MDNQELLSDSAGSMTNENLFAFKKHLDPCELYRFELEQEKIDNEKNSRMLELMKKYNTIVSDRISRDVLIGEIKDSLSSEFSKVQSVLESFDEKTLQTISSLIRLVKKENSLS